MTLFCPGPTFTNFLQNSFTAKEGEVGGFSSCAKVVFELNFCSNTELA